ncbi:hypothetical protein ACFV9C_27905 [Kribbella sp. NPDC059898]|uniref:hypothetical protein n=1 Tax=Kribbella sp. NPDC059898 TaxID=3346995 RepID=UPI0036521512
MRRLLPDRVYFWLVVRKRWSPWARGYDAGFNDGMDCAAFHADRLVDKTEAASLDVSRLRELADLYREEAGQL